MNNTANPEKYRKLSIVSLITAVSAVLFGFLVFCISMGDPQGVRGWIIWSTIIFLYLICLPIPAIVCGSIDLKRIKAGYHSNKGFGLDIVGIVLGVVIAFPGLFFVILGLLTALKAF